MHHVSALAENPVLAEMHRAAVERRKRMDAAAASIQPKTGTVLRIARAPLPKYPSVADMRANSRGAEIYSTPIGPMRFIFTEAIEIIKSGRVERSWALAELTPENVTPDDLVPFKTIEAWVLNKHKITKVELQGCNRADRFVKARQELAGLAKRHTLMSFPEIGRRMGGRDHTTVLHSSRRFEAWVAEGRLVPWSMAMLAPEVKEP